MRKLLYIHNWDFPAESANRVQVINMCEWFVENDIDVSLLAFESDMFQTENNLFDSFWVKNKFHLILIKKLWNYYIRSIKIFFYFTFQLRKEFDSIFTRDLFVAFLIKVFFQNKKVVYELHEINERVLWKKLFKITFDRLDKLVVISNWLKIELVNSWYNWNKIEVLHDGVNLWRFVWLKKEIWNDKINITYTWSLIPWKWVETLLKAFETIHIDNVYLNIYWWNKNEIWVLKNKYKDNNIIFHWRVDNKYIPQILMNSDILVLPNSWKYKISTDYTSPLKLFEYMAAWKVIIASNLPSINDVLSDEECIFFKADNCIDLKDRILLVLWKKVNIEKMKNNCNSKIKNYTWKIRWWKIYLNKQWEW